MDQYSEEALAEHEDITAARIRVLGPNHPDTLHSHAQYVRWTGKAGRFVEAVDLAEQLATDSVRALGAEHLDTNTPAGSPRAETTARRSACSAR